MLQERPFCYGIAWQPLSVADWLQALIGSDSPLANGRCITAVALAGGCSFLFGAAAQITMVV